MLQSSRALNVLIACEESGMVRDAFRLRGHNAWSNDLKPGRGAFPDFHLQGDAILAVRGLVRTAGPPIPPVRWDLVIAHPECTYITCSAEWAYGDGPYHQRVKPGTLVGAAPSRARDDAIAFWLELWDACGDAPRCFENPAVGALSSRWRPPDQVVQPYQFGDNASKATGLWLHGLAPLRVDPAQYVQPRWICCGLLLDLDRVGKYGCANCHGDRKPRPRWANQTDSGQNRLSPGEGRAAERSVTYSGIASAMADQWGGIVVQSVT